MTEYALLVNNKFSGIYNHNQRPQNIPHKDVTWHNVRREYGTPYTGLDGDVWIIRTINPSTLPPPVPNSITRRQAALELNAQGVITLTEALAMVKTATVPAVINAIFNDQVAHGVWTVDQRILAEIDFAADNYYRSNDLLGLMGLTPVQIDQFFISAGSR